MSLNTVKYKGELLAEDERISTDTPGVLGEYKELRADALEADTLDITVLSESGTIRSFKKNDKVEYFRSGSRVGVYYLQSVTRVGPKLYTLSALSAVGLLIVRPHRGGIYTGQTVAEVVAEICGDIPVLVETVYRGIKLYGWLPIASARDSLVQVLFAIGAWLHTDENGTLRVQKLWNGTASIIGPGSVHAANIQVKYLDPVSAVAVTEHQYIAGTEDVTLFEGTAQQGDVIEFDEPAHTLTAEGFTILERGANYAVLSAGTGKLTGKSYVHNRRVVTRTVTEGAAENVEEITDATLVSLVNSSAVAQRMAAYYACREQLTVDVNPAGEHAGHVVSLWNEWDKQQTLACIASRETKISGLLKSRTSALVGFLPPQPDTTVIYNERDLISESGDWTIPDNVTELHYVLISGGSGGLAGEAGNAGSSSNNATASAKGGSSYTPGGKGGKGGAGGLGGSGGKVVSGDITVTPGNVLHISVGTGGGAGEDGTDTTLTVGEIVYSSADGASSAIGYTDATTGETFAATGDSGENGGNGGDGGRFGDSSSSTSGADGESVGENTGGSGGVSSTGSGGQYISSYPNYIVTSTGSETKLSGGETFSGYVRISMNESTGIFTLSNYQTVTYTYGQRPAYTRFYSGGNGSQTVTGTDISGTPTNYYSQPIKVTGVPSYSSPGYYYGKAGGGGGGASGKNNGSAGSSGPGGKGADGGTQPDETVYGKGGPGGNGGGGGGGAGGSGASTNAKYTESYTSYGSSGGVGGAAGIAGGGAPGCVILYYGKPKLIPSGWLKDKNGKLVLDRLGRRIIK